MHPVFKTGVYHHFLYLPSGAVFYCVYGKIVRRKTHDVVYDAEV